MAEQTASQPAPAVASPAAPVPSEQDNLIAQYDAEAESSSPDVPAPEETSPTPPARPLPERNPDGTFRASTPASEGRKPSQAMVQMAQDLGLTPDEIAATPADALEVAVYHLSKQSRQRQAIQQGRETAVEQDRHQLMDRNLGSQGGGSPAGPEPHTQPEAAVPEEKPFDLGLEETQYDPALMAALRKLATAHADQSKELKSLKQQLARIDRLEHLEVARANESFAQKMDRLFSGDEATFGKGEGRTLAADGPELAKRRAVLGEMQRIPNGTIEEKYDKAYQKLYGSVKPPIHEQIADVNAELAARQDEWRRGNVARPTQRVGGTEPPSAAKATRSVAKILAEQNGVGGESGELEADDLPG